MKNTTNFAADFQKVKEHNYKSFFQNFSNSVELMKAQQELKKMQKEVEKKQHEVITLQDKRYNADFVIAPEKYCLVYTSRNYTNFYFDIETGDGLFANTDGAFEIKLPTKTGTFSYVRGYNFSLSAVLIREIDYAINSNNTNIRFTKIKEILVPMMEDEVNESIASNVMITSSDYCIPDKALSRVDANFFINNYFGINVNIICSLKNLKQYLHENKSAEIILKTATTRSIMRNLLERKIDKPMPIYKIVGCSKESWEAAYNEGVQYEFLRLKQAYTNEALKPFKKTDYDWIEFLKSMVSREQDLTFYNINYEGNLAFTLINKFMGYGYYDYKDFHKFYKFGKFCNYVVDETINQGINSINNFIQLLTDYLKMCGEIGITPTLYSSYLKQTHDICSRNHSVAITKEMDEVFALKYEGFEIYKNEHYVVIAPNSCSDLQAEGDALNHCVASYITRVINNECKIFFLRDKDDIARSLITVEVRDGAIVQARGIHNRDIDTYEKLALKEFAMERNLKYKV